MRMGEKIPKEKNPVKMPSNLILKSLKFKRNVFNEFSDIPWQLNFPQKCQSI